MTVRNGVQAAPNRDSRESEALGSAGSSGVNESRISEIPVKEVEASAQQVETAQPQATPTQTQHQRQIEAGNPATVSTVRKSTTQQPSSVSVSKPVESKSQDRPQAISPQEITEIASSSGYDNIVPYSTDDLMPTEISQEIQPNVFSASIQRSSSAPQPTPEIFSTEQQEKDVEQADIESKTPVANNVPRIREKAQQQTVSLPNIRFSSAQERAKEDVVSNVRNRIFKGMSVYGKAQSDSNLKLNEISIGTAEVQQLMELPNSSFVQYVAKETETSLDPATATVEDVVAAITANNVECAVTKSPNNRTASVQRRVLRVHDGRGIRLHPIAAKMFNADFDGDDFAITFKRSAIARAKDPMKYLIDIDGELGLDPDFFPKGVYRNAPIEQVQQFIYDEIFGINGIVDTDVARKSLAEFYATGSTVAFYEFCKEVSNKSHNDAMAEKTIRMAYNGLRRLSLIDAATGSGMWSSKENMPPIETQHDAGLANMVEDMVNDSLRSRVTKINNFQDLKIVLCEYLGEDPGTNPSFRFSANIAKMFKFDTKIQIGSAEHVDDVMQKVLAYVESVKISNAVFESEDNRSIAEMMRRRIITSVGFPEQYPSFGSFIARFIEVYRRNETVMEYINNTVYTDMSMGKGKTAGLKRMKSKELGDVTSCLLDVYGNFEASRIFSDIGFRQSPAKFGKESWGNLDVNSKYENRSLWQIKDSNTFYSSYAEHNENVAKRTFSQNSSTVCYDMFVCLCDMRASAAVTYHNKLMEAMRSIGTLVSDLANPEMRGREWSKYISDILELVYESSPDVFSFYGMDSPKTFVESKYGKAIIASKGDAVKLMSIRMAMVTEYRIARIAEAEDHAFFDAKTAEEQGELNNKVAIERQVLGSSSLAWNAIVKDIMLGEQSAFSRFKAGEVVKNRDGRDANMSAAAYWRSNAQHENIIDLLLDVNASAEDKQNAVSDLVKENCHFLRFNSKEVPYQLDLGKTSQWSDTPVYSESIMGTLDGFNDRFNSYQDLCYKNLKANIQAAYDYWGSQTGKLNKALNYYSRNHSRMVTLDDGMYADALCSILDKVYGQSEKSKQHPWTNSLFHAISHQRDFGFYNDVYASDSRAIGVVPYDQVTPYDIIDILAGTKDRILAFDRAGELHELSLLTLTGSAKDSEELKWKFLMENPRIASCLRPHMVCNGNAGAYVAITGSTSDFIGSGQGDMHLELSDIKSALRNHPGYAAIIALITPTNERTTRTMRSSYLCSEDHVASAVVHCAMQDDPKFSVRSYVEKRLGVSVDALVAAGVSEGQAKEIVDEVANLMGEYAEEVKLLDGFDGANISIKFHKASVDLGSAYAFYDARQEMSGAKTEISTGVEGTITQKDFTWLALLSAKDRYDDVAAYDTEELAEKFGQCMTSEGRTVAELIESGASLDDVIIELPEGFDRSDKSSEKNGKKQLSSVASYIIVKRDNGAEKFNLKVKKSGDDGLDAIVKRGKYLGKDFWTSEGRDGLYDYDMLTKATNEAYEQKGRFGALMVLARHLKDANSEIQYTELTMADCVNIADVMLVEDEAGESVSIRALEQVVAAVKNAVSMRIMQEGSPSDIVECAKNAAMASGLAVDMDPSSILSEIRLSKPTLRDRPLAGVRGRSSSLVRNFDMLSRIVESVRSEDRELFGEIELGNKSAMISKASGLPRKIAGYDVLGSTKANQYVKRPGPKTLWVLEGGQLSNVDNLCRMAYRLGISVCMSSEFVASNPFVMQFESDFVPMPTMEDSHVLIPFFDMRLNGSESLAVPSDTREYKVDPDSYVISYEDSLNEYDLGDASIQFFKSLIDRIKVNWGDVAQMTIANLFSNVFAMNQDKDVYPVTDPQERSILIQRMLNGDETISVDYGVSKGSEDFDSRVKLVNAAIARYADNPSLDENMVARKDLKRGDIVTFIAIKVYDGGKAEQTVLAPVIPFELKGSNEVSNEFVPSLFEVTGDVDFSFNGHPAASAISVPWRFSDTLAGHYLKMFEGMGAANKFMGTVDQTVQGGKLDNGMPIDCCYAKESTASRRLGTNKRINTLETMMVIARLQGYNLAESDKAFPNDEEMKQALLSGPVPVDWFEQRLADDSYVWHEDKLVNAFLKIEIAKYMQRIGNPSNLLASRFDGEQSDIMWDFKMMFSDSLSYQNGLMSFLHAVDDGFCPRTLDEVDHDRYLFMPSSGKGFDRNCMQANVPHVNPETGQEFRTRENLFAGRSFFGTDASMFHQVNPNASFDYMDALQTMAVSGEMPKGDDFRNMLKFALKDISGSEMVDMFIDAETLSRSNKE